MADRLDVRIRDVAQGEVVICSYEGWCMERWFVVRDAEGNEIARRRTWDPTQGVPWR